MYQLSGFAKIQYIFAALVNQMRCPWQICLNFASSNEHLKANLHLVIDLDTEPITLNEKYF